MEISQSCNHLYLIMSFLIFVRQHLYTESGSIVSKLPSQNALYMYMENTTDLCVKSIIGHTRAIEVKRQIQTEVHHVQ